jgi:HAD superfamily hydrolase (TIGR01509 family)
MIEPVVSAGQRRYAALDAVTLDANGTLVELVDPVPRLTGLLREWDVERSPGAVRAAFRAEAEYYVPRSHLAGDGESLRLLWRDCTQVFLEAAGADLDADAFAPHYVGALEFEVIPGVPEALGRLRERGLALAVVSNWDISLHGRLASLGLDALVDTVVASADVGVAKPDPRLFRAALERLGAEPGRALHVGDRDEDEQGARAAGLGFEPAPLAEAFRAWT